MTCQQAVEHVTDYLEGALPPDERTRLEEHLRDCRWCAVYLQQMRVTIATVGRIPEESLSLEARTTLLVAFSDWSAAQQPLREPPE